VGEGLDITVSGTRARATSRSSGLDILLSALGVVLCLGLALLVRLLVHDAVFICFMPAVLFSLWLGGRRMALYATVLSALVIDYFLIPPIFSFNLSHSAAAKELVFLVITAGTVCWFVYLQRRSDRLIQAKENLIDSLQESVVVFDKDMRVLSWNSGAEKLYGWSRQEVIGNCATAFVTVQNPADVAAIGQHLRETGHWHGRVVVSARSGDPIVLESSVALDPESGNRLVVAMDVTKRVQAEEEAKRATSALRTLSRVNQLLIHATHADELLKQAMEAIIQEGGYSIAFIGVPVHDEERSVKVGPYAGKQDFDFSGYQVSWADVPEGCGPTGTALRENRIVVSHNPQSDPKMAVFHALAERNRTRSVISLPLRVQENIYSALTLVAKEENAFTGREFDLLSEVAANLSYGLTSIRLREEAEEERASRLFAEEQLRQSQKMEAIGKLAGGIAHDFNNLLMVIMAQTELLSLQLTGDGLTRANSIMHSASRAAELTSQLLAFSRKQIISPKVQLLSPILSDLSKLLERLVGEDIEISTHISDDAWPVKIDRSQMEQVILNLAVNARDAMPSGGKLTLEVANAEIADEYIKTHPLVLPGRYVMLAVTDNGTGMDAATQAHIFEPFFTTKEAGKGTGLGLATVYGVVKQSDGFIWLYSEVGRGTTFKVYLPAVTEGASHQVENAPEPVLTVRPITILLVEDEIALREVIAEFLRSNGHTVLCAQSEEEALQAIADHGGTFDLLLTDVVLRGKNGKQLAQSLRDRGYSFRVIYMSGYTPNAIVHHGVLDEGTKFLQKPFTRNSLLAKVREALSE